MKSVEPCTSEDQRTFSVLYLIEKAERNVIRKKSEWTEKPLFYV